MSGSDCDQICQTTSECSLAHRVFRSYAGVTQCVQHADTRTHKVIIIITCFDLWQLCHHSVLHWTAHKIIEYCWAHHSLLHSLIHREWLTVVGFTVTANEIAANSVSCLLCLLLTEKQHTLPLPRQKKRKNRLYSTNISKQSCRAFVRTLRSYLDG